MWCFAKCSILISFFVWCLIKIVFKIFKKKDQKSIAFFHPYANAGGGGERVLWQSVRCLQVNYPDYDYYILTGDKINDQQLIDNVERSFKIKLIKPIKCVQIKTRFLVEAKYYKVFTLLAQSLASIILAIECMTKLNPVIVFDTMGYAFTYWFFRLFNCKVVSYTHYPTISTDMLQTVTNSENAFNNQRLIARNRFLTNLKLIYYKIFAKIYGFMGRFTDMVMVNSSWTLNHINELWNIPDRTYLVYPPCNTDSYQKLSLENPYRNKNQILSLAQFRPEKNHKLQIYIIERLLNKLSNDDQKANLKLVLIGSVRDETDQSRVEDLKELVKNLNLEKNVEFKLNISFKELVDQMAQSNIGIHTMKNEHFGIAVVESMAAGLIMIANNSAGPRMDIIDHEENGYLATTLDEYVDIINNVLNKEDNELVKLRKNARTKSTKFSDDNFEKSFLESIKSLF